MGLEFKSAAADLPIDAAVGKDDDDARQQEAEDEQKFLRRLVVLTQDGAREGGRVVAKPPPHPQQRRQHDGEAERPGEQNLQHDVTPRVNPVVETVTGDQNVPEKQIKKYILQFLP